MDRTFYSYIVSGLAALVVSAGSLQAEGLDRFAGPYSVAPAAYGTDFGPNDPLARLEKRLQEMETRHQEHVESLQGRIAGLERQLQQGGTQGAPIGEDRRPPLREDDLELEVERLLRQAQEGPEIAPPVDRGPAEEAELDIEALLRAGEERRAEAAPELGAGLGARLSAFNPNISAIGNFLGVVSSGPDSWFDPPAIPLAGFDQGDIDGFAFDELELLMTAAIDPYADGMAKIAFGEEGAEIEECYAQFHDYPFRDRLPESLRDVETKVGLFRMAFGPMNQVDDHDLPTVDRPLAIRHFLGDEGLIRAGFSFSKVFPSRGPWGRELVLEFTHGAAPGGTLSPEPPARHSSGGFPFTGEDYPLGLVHYSVFRECDPCTGFPIFWRGYRTFELGATFAATGSRASEGREHLYSLVQGLDFTWQWMHPRPDIYRQYMLQSEVFMAELDQPGDGRTFDVGGYVLGQVRLDRRWFTGLRFDATEFPDREGYHLAATPYVTYFFTEFNRARFQYQYLEQDTEAEGTEDAHTVWFQLVFALGAHPPEPYYITQRF